MGRGVSPAHKNAAASGAEHHLLEVGRRCPVVSWRSRYFERARRHDSGAAMGPMLDMGAKDVAVLRAARARSTISPAGCRDVFVSAPASKSPPTVLW